MANWSLMSAILFSGPQVSLTASLASPRNRDSAASGVVTLPTWSGTSPPRPSTSPSRTSTSRCSWAVLTNTPSSGDTLPATWPPAVLLEPPPSASSTPSTSPVPGKTKYSTFLRGLAHTYFVPRMWAKINCNFCDFSIIENELIIWEQI